MPARPGSQHAAKRRDFEHTVRRALLADNGVRIRQAAETLLDLAAKGERWAVECLRDTLDGKPAQSVDVAITRSVPDMDDATLAGVLAQGSGSGTPGEADVAPFAAGVH